MPGIGGLAAIRRIRAMAPRAGIIVVTAVADEAMVRLAFRCGVDDYLQKPVDLNDLLASVRMQTPGVG